MLLEKIRGKPLSCCDANQFNIIIADTNRGHIFYIKLRCSQKLKKSTLIKHLMLLKLHSKKHDKSAVDKLRTVKALWFTEGIIINQKCK